MKIKPQSFKAKLIFSYIFIILASFGFIAYFLSTNLEENSLQEIKSSLLKQAYLIENQVPAVELKSKNRPYLDSLTKTLSAKINSRITIIDSSGRVLADSEKSLEDTLGMENHADRPEIMIAMVGGIGESIRYSSTLKIDMLYLAIPIKEADEIIGTIRVALPLVSVQKTILTIKKVILVSLFFACVLAFILSALVSRAIMKPISRIIYVSRKFSQRDFKHKIFVSSKDEIGELAVTLNEMAQSLEDKIKQTEIQNQHLLAILESMVEGIIVIDKATHIVSLNSTIENIFNISKKEAEGKNFLEVIRNNDLVEIINTVLEKGEPLSKELSLVWPVEKTFQVNAVPIFAKEMVSACLLVIHDISGIRKLETMRQDFVANVSHELKTPLTSIKGFVETLQEGALEDKENSRHFLQIIQEHVERLDYLVNDLLDLSYLESKGIILEKEKFDLQALIDEVLSGFKAQLKKKAVTAANDIPSGLIICADKDKIRQVLTNLIDNAIKFNHEKGKIKIYSQDLTEKIKLVVEDSGLGIPPKDIPRIFERFYRVDKARSRQLGGTGLGLSIVKHIVELHNGTVGVESTEGFGSKFWFSLPK